MTDGVVAMEHRHARRNAETTLPSFDSPVPTRRADASRRHFPVLETRSRDVAPRVNWEFEGRLFAG
jgi:hypothetical protein